MLHSGDFNFSFSGLKTAVLYVVKKRNRITEKFKKNLSAEFEDAVSEVLIKKTQKAIQKYDIQSLIIGGGVSANNRLRTDFQILADNQGFTLYLPNKKYTGDNALMIAVAGYYNLKNNTYEKNAERVTGNLKLGNK